MGKKFNAKYLVAITFMLLFTFCDLLFDYAFTFRTSDYVSFNFTLLSAIIVFIGTFYLNRTEKNKYYKTTAFVQSNFNNMQVLFSILDIICGLISVISTLYFMGCIFKFVKFIYIPVKVVVVVNKEKSLIKPVTKFSYMWTATRILELEGVVMKKIGNFFKTIGLWLFANKKTIIGTLSAVFGGVSTAIAQNAELISVLPNYVVGKCNITAIVIGLIVFGLTELGVTGKGLEAIKDFFERVAKEKADKEQEKFDKIVLAKIKAEDKQANQTQAEQEKQAKKEAKAKEKADAKAKEKAEFDEKIAKAVADYRAKQNTEVK